MSMSASPASQHSSLGRKRVIAMGIAFPDTAIPAVDKKLGFLIASDLSTCINRLALGPVNGRSSLTACATDSPPVFMRHNMLIAF